MQRPDHIRRHIAVALAVVALALLAACASPEATPSPTPSPEPTGQLDEEMLERRWTVLLVGIDRNAAREERNEPVNADAIMLASLSDDQSQLALVSLPRDTVDVPLPDGDTYDGKINSLYREEGIDTFVGAMEELFGVPIDGYVVIDMDDFTRLVDAVGTIEVSPDEPLEDPIVNLDLEAGAQEIDGETANGYVRTRVDQDYGRMGRQQEVLLALADRLADPETDVEPSSVVESLDSLETDLPLDELPTLVELARRAADADAERRLVEPPLITFEGDRGDGRGYILEADVEAIQSEVQELIGD